MHSFINDISYYRLSSIRFPFRFPCYHALSIFAFLPNKTTNLLVVLFSLRYLVHLAVFSTTRLCANAVLPYYVITFLHLKQTHMRAKYGDITIVILFIFILPLINEINVDTGSDKN